MIHVDQEHAVERLRREHRVVGRAELDRDIVEPFALDAVAELVADLGNDVLGEHPPLARRPPRARRTV